MSTFPPRFALRGGSAEVDELLLRAGADPNAFDGLYRPVDVGLKWMRADVAALLRAAGGTKTPPG